MSKGAQGAPRGPGGPVDSRGPKGPKGFYRTPSRVPLVCTVGPSKGARGPVGPVDQVHDRTKAMAAACLALVVGHPVCARRWAERAFEIEREEAVFSYRCPRVHSADFAENFPPAWRSWVGRHDR
jgi:hypothetical protein